MSKASGNPTFISKSSLHFTAFKLSFTYAPNLNRFVTCFPSNNTTLIPTSVPARGGNCTLSPARLSVRQVKHPRYKTGLPPTPPSPRTGWQVLPILLVLKLASKTYLRYNDIMCTIIAAGERTVVWFIKYVQFSYNLQ